MYDGRIIGLRVKHERKARGWSMRQLADKIEDKHPHISLLEGGKIPNPSLDLIARLADAFGLTVDDLVGRTTDATTHELGQEALDAQGITPLLSEIQVSTLRIGELDPEGLESLGDIVRAMRERAERVDREERNAIRKRRQDADKRGGSPDGETPSS